MRETGDRRAAIAAADEFLLGGAVRLSTVQQGLVSDYLVLEEFYLNEAFAKVLLLSLITISHAAYFLRRQLTRKRSQLLLRPTAARLPSERERHEGYVKLLCLRECFKLLMFTTRVRDAVVPKYLPQAT